MTQQEELKKAQEEFRNCFTVLKLLAQREFYDAMDETDWDLVNEAANNVARAANLCKLNVLQYHQEKEQSAEPCPQCQREIAIRAAFGSPKVPWTCFLCRKEHEQ